MPELQGHRSLRRRDRWRASLLLEKVSRSGRAPRDERHDPSGPARRAGSGRPSGMLPEVQERRAGRRAPVVLTVDDPVRHAHDNPASPVLPGLRAAIAIVGRRPVGVVRDLGPVRHHPHAGADPAEPGRHDRRAAAVCSVGAPVPVDPARDCRTDPRACRDSTPKLTSRGCGRRSAARRSWRRTR
jgi:hypothetical protein